MKKEYLFAAGAVVCWSTVAPITKILLNEMSAGLCLFLTTSIAALTLFVYKNSQLTALSTGCVSASWDFSVFLYITLHITQA